MDFLHCQQCGHWPRFQPGSHQRYFMTSCGHLYCQTCLHALSDKCPSCQGECRILEVNGQSNEDVRAHFKDPLSILRDALKKPLQILQFQHNQQKDCVRIYGKLMEAYNRTKNENGALKAEILLLKQSNEELKQQNHQLQIQGRIDAESRQTMTFAAPTSSHHSEMSKRGGNDVLNLFREPPERPNVQVPPQVMVAPVSSNPVQYTPRVKSAGFSFPMPIPTPQGQMSANKRPAYSVQRARVIDPQKFLDSRFIL
ncbi:unnamed protein product [Orchesella dallaii]|uniref:RING-type domain-containing protein n=1 Tax=Orchesella dallaii TaxID=48710 RepID=A0ABP1QZ02_9HEXA